MSVNYTVKQVIAQFEQFSVSLNHADKLQAASKLARYFESLTREEDEDDNEDD